MATRILLEKHFRILKNSEISDLSGSIGGVCDEKWGEVCGERKHAVSMHAQSQATGTDALRPLAVLQATN
jgi:hypothetical protein